MTAGIEVDGAALGVTRRFCHRVRERVVPRAHRLDRPYTRSTVADLPIALPVELADRLARALDVEGKIPAALEALGPVGGRDVGFVDTAGGSIVDAVRSIGARTTPLERDPASWRRLPAASLDVLVGLWSAFRGGDVAELAGAERLLRPGGRLLVLHDYGRDDVSRLRGELPEHGEWSRRHGPFLGVGFRVRVVHCWWTFDTVEMAREFLAACFGPAGEEIGASLKRPRLSYNVAVYHRTRLVSSA
jgi:hypothetical protein